LPLRSTRARTRSPGMAPNTSTTWPAWRASMRPPAAGFSTSSVRVSGVKADDRQRGPLAKQAVDRRALRLLVGVGRHPIAKRRELGLGLRPNLRQRLLVARRPGRIGQRLLEFAQAMQQRLPRLAAQPLRRCARPVDLAHDIIDGSIDHGPAEA